MDDIFIITKDKIILGENVVYTGSDFESKIEHINKHSVRISDYKYDTLKMNWDWSYKYDYIPGLACHKNCYLLLYKKFKKKFKFEYFAPLLNEDSILDKYDTTIDKYVGRQDFILHDYLNNFNPNRSFLEHFLLKNKEFKINNKNLNYLLNPLKNKENADRILKIWTPIIKNTKSKKPISKKLRPSPSDSATKYKVGKKKEGNDKNMYIIAKNKNGVKRWKKLN